MKLQEDDLALSLAVAVFTLLIDATTPLTVNCYLSESNVFAIKKAAVTFMAPFCSHMTYCCANVTTDGLMDKMDNYRGTIDDKLFLSARVRNPDLKVLVGLGGDRVQKMARQPETRKQLISSIGGHTAKYGYQGIFVLWTQRPQWSSADQISSSKDLSDFLVDVRQAFGPNFTIGLIGPENGGHGSLSKYPCDVIEKTVDMIDMNTKGLSGGLLMTPAPLYLKQPSSFFMLSSINETLTNWLACGVSPAKLLIRVSNMAAKHMAGNDRQPPEPIPQHRMCNSVFGYKFDPDWALAMATNDADVYIFEDDAPLVVKAKYLVSYGLAGMTVFNEPYGDSRGVCGEGLFPTLQLVSSMIKGLQLNGTLSDTPLNLGTSTGDVAWLTYSIGGAMAAFCIAAGIVVKVKYSNSKNEPTIERDYAEVYYSPRSYIEIIEPAMATGNMLSFR
ncbi:hypothetical protein HDE_07803 [Halotydeus destructor]|nr:hypothetical protein HDE_07803 [Halotydeus destructor]